MTNQAPSETAGYGIVFARHHHPRETSHSSWRARKMKHPRCSRNGAGLRAAGRGGARRSPAPGHPELLKGRVAHAVALCCRSQAAPAPRSHQATPQGTARAPPGTQNPDPRGLLGELGEPRMVSSPDQSPHPSQIPTPGSGACIRLSLPLPPRSSSSGDTARKPGR